MIYPPPIMKWILVEIVFTVTAQYNGFVTVTVCQILPIFWQIEMLINFLILDQITRGRDKK